MSSKAYLTLENGMVFEGRPFGARKDVTGEVVFNTGMAGYLETLTDPGYYGQIVLQTFPLVGNYGVIPSDFESDTVKVAAYIVKEPCQDPSNFRSEGNLDAFLKQKDIAGICNIDTRALTMVIRENGVLNGKITYEKPDTANAGEMNQIKGYKIKNAAAGVSVKQMQRRGDSAKYRVAMLDFGHRASLVQMLEKTGCEVYVFPHDSTPSDIMQIKPHGIMLSNGPGDPTDNTVAIDNIEEMLGRNIPFFGVGLGHQLLALANGFKTVKLKHGHRGGNYPVKDLCGGRVYITSQNHGYVVDSASIDKSKAEEWLVNGNDKTCEGIAYKNAPAFSVQFYPENCGGPNDAMFLFDRFAKNMEVYKNAVE